MDYAVQAMEKVRSSVTLSPDMGQEAFFKAVHLIWKLTADETATKLKLEPELQSVYRGIFHQARDTATDFRWLGQPEVKWVKQEKKSEQKSNVLSKMNRFITSKGLYVLALFLLGVSAVFMWEAENWKALIPGIAGAVMLVMTKAPSLWDQIRELPTALKRHREQAAIKKDPSEAVRVEQRIDPVAAWNSLKKIARTVDENAAALYAHFVQRTDQSLEDMDGLPLAKALLDWDCQEEQVPEELRSELRLYLQSKGIEALPYSPERSAIFQMMPANSTRTLEPALVRKVKTMRDGVMVEEEQLLLQGLACVKQES